VSEEFCPIDVRHLGRERVICCWRVGDVLVDPGPASALETLLGQLDGFEPRALALTHVHLDHAGAAGSLAARFPGLEVWVHERGARHLIDPSRLVHSARRLYGEEMDRLWGEVLAVPEERVRVLGDQGSIGGLRYTHTPGHASHHVCYLHEPSGWAFVGDVAGVRIPPADYVRPPTPPPDIDLEAWRRSVARVRGWAPERLALTHFGAFPDVERHLYALERGLDDFAQLAAGGHRRAFIDGVAARVAAATDPQTAAVYEQAAPAEHLWLGLERYLNRLCGGAAGRPAAPSEGRSARGPAQPAR